MEEAVVYVPEIAEPLMERAAAFRLLPPGNGLMRE
jgi:hypothetical protein